ncbi:purine-cytosine permease family protein [Pseudalkalibacillus caeni]|uniref:Cytosine permease n=1 Tax=Exobacillus caeni TaxID=2574798 RepID=A0A5R9FEU9_9BACL|nr:cytosine permease [Pseudalkalibacillus caeni]TLS39114.1 cytosine permease [Pseudalkalibacillus caeni]
MGLAKEDIQKKKIGIERFGLESIPEHLRNTSWLEYAVIQIAISVNAGNFLVPATAVLEGGLSFFWAVVSTVIGAAAAFLFVSFLSIPGAKQGIPSQYAIRLFVGVKGARYFASPVRTITSLYWFAVQTIGGAYIVIELAERLFNKSLSFTATALVLATVMAGLALVGFNAVKRITRYFLPVLLLGGIAMIAIYIRQPINGNSFAEVIQVDSRPSISTMSFFASLAFVQYVSGVSSASDMARYAKTARQGFIGLYAGNVIGFLITSILGAYTAAAAQHWNPFLITSRETESAILLFFIFTAAIASMITINISNAYTGGYSLLNTFPILGRVKSAILLGVFAVLLSTVPSLVNEARSFITLLGGFIIPLSAIIATDFIVIKKCRFYHEDLALLNENNWSYNTRGFCSLALGTVVYFFLPDSYSPGFLTFVLTGVIYYFCHTKRGQ